MRLPAASKAQPQSGLIRFKTLGEIIDPHPLVFTVVIGCRRFGTESGHGDQKQLLQEKESLSTPWGGDLQRYAGKVFTERNTEADRSHGWLEERGFAEKKECHSKSGY